MTAYEFRHFLRKLWKTTNLVATLFMARTFGKYEISVWDNGLSYAKYRWRGRLYAIPTEPIDEEFYGLARSQR